jgi:ketosteroid isomerase-like protein
MDYQAAQAAGDAAAIQRILADEVEWIPPASAPVEGARGRDAVLAALASAGARFFDLPTMKSEVHKIIADGDTVAIQSRMQCRAVNGRDYTNEYVWVYTCAGGQIVRMQEYADTLRFQQIVLD